MSIEEDKKTVLEAVRIFYKDNLYKHQRLGMGRFEPLTFLDRIVAKGVGPYRGYIFQVSWDLFTGDIWLCLYDVITDDWHFQYAGEVN